MLINVIHCPSCKKVTGSTLFNPREQAKTAPVPRHNHADGSVHVCKTVEKVEEANGPGSFPFKTSHGTVVRNVDEWLKYLERYI